MHHYVRISDARYELELVRVSELVEGDKFLVWGVEASAAFLSFESCSSGVLAASGVEFLSTPEFRLARSNTVRVPDSGMVYRVRYSASRPDLDDPFLVMVYGAPFTAHVETLWNVPAGAWVVGDGRSVFHVEGTDDEDDVVLVPVGVEGDRVRWSGDLSVYWLRPLPEAVLPRFVEG